MDTTRIELDPKAARTLWRDYKKHQHWSEPIDQEVMRTYQAIAQGRVVIRALASITAAGLNTEGLPKLAIARADAQFCWLQADENGAAVFASDERALIWQAERMVRRRIAFPRGSFSPPVSRHRWRPRAIVPQIPLPLRPKRGLANYHILFEAEWELVPPTDPLLLRRVGNADLWIVCAAWDLTEVERTVLAARIGRA
jgi:hypothetical protein